MSEWTSRCIVSTVMILGIIIGIYYTNSANCLWALFIPYGIMYDGRNDNKKPEALY